MYGRPQIVNKRIRLHWAGWTSDTLQLSLAGWQVSAQQDVMRQTMRLAIRHPSGAKGITHLSDYNYDQLSRVGYDPMLDTGLSFEGISSNCIVYLTDEQEIFRPIDCRPTVSRLYELDDIAHFRTVTPEHEVYLKEANINQILEMALKVQEPNQERIRKEMLRKRELEKHGIGRAHTELRLVV